MFEQYWFSADYIYIYKDRDRDRERQREIERESGESISVCWILEKYWFSADYTYIYIYIVTVLVFGISLHGFIVYKTSRNMSSETRFHATKYIYKLIYIYIYLRRNEEKTIKYIYKQIYICLFIYIYIYIYIYICIYEEKWGENSSHLFYPLPPFFPVSVLNYFIHKIWRSPVNFFRIFWFYNTNVTSFVFSLYIYIYIYI